MAGKVIVYGEVGQAPIAVEDNLKNGEVRTDQKLIQNPALLAAIQDINSSGGKLLLDSMLGQPGRLMATLSPTFRSSVKQFVAKNTDYDSGIGTQPFLLCEIPPVCALCLAACHLLAEDARLTCEPLQGDDRWNCFINAGRDELTCGLICL